MAGALALAGLWVILFVTAVVITATPPPAPSTRPVPWSAGLRAELDGSPPALVNLAVTRCKLDGAAYAATILDLAARGCLVLTQPRAGHLQCALPPAPAGAPRLPQSGRLVLVAVTDRLMVDGPAPFEALAERCSADVPGTWDPFERAVRREGRDHGLTRPRLPAAVTSSLYAGATALGLVTFLAVHSRPHTGLWPALTAAFFAVLLPAYWTRSVARQDRLTRSGGGLAAGAAATVAGAPDGWADGIVSGEPAPAGVASRLAAAVAAHAPVPMAGIMPGTGIGVRPGGRRAAARIGISGLFESTDRPRAAWSSWSGEWRLVVIPPPRLPLRGNPVAFLALSVWAGLLCYPASLLPGIGGALVLAALAASAVAAGAGAALALVRRLAQPAEVIFDAQVIARWVERRGSGDDDVYVPCFAVDDGQRAWSADTGRGGFGRLSVGDSVRVRAAPRSGTLLGLVSCDAPPRAPAAARSITGETDGQCAAMGPGRGPAGSRLPDGRLLLTSGEAAEILGGPVRETGFSSPLGAGVIYRADGGRTVSVTVADGLPGRASVVPGRRAGEPLAGIGDEAWMLNRDRSAVVRVAGLTAKITISGPGGPSHPGVLPGLAAAAGRRLAEHAIRP